MANRYWVGGSGTWNTTSTTNWSDTSGGASGATRPTTADSVFFDQAGTYTVTMTGALNCLDITVSAGTVTFQDGTTPTLTVAGSWSTTAGTLWNTTGTVTFNATTSRTIDTNGTIIASGITFTGTGSVTLANNLTAATNGRTVTLTQGTLNLQSYTLTSSIFTSSGASARTLNFGTGKILLNGSANTTVWDTSTATSLTVTGTPVVETQGGGTAVTKTISTGNLSEANAISFGLLETSGTVTYAFAANNIVKNLTIDGSQSITNTAINIYGNYTYNNSNGTTTFTAGTNVWRFGANTGSVTISAGTPTYDFPIEIGHATSTATFNLSGNITLGNTRTFTVTGGNLSLGNNTVSTGLFASSNANTRTITGPGTFNITNITTTTVWNTLTQTGLSVLNTPLITFASGGTSITKTLAVGQARNGAFNVNLANASGTVTYAFTPNDVVNDLTISGTQTITNNTIEILGNLTYTGGSTTFSSGSNPWVLGGNSNINTNNVSMPFPIMVSTGNSKPSIRQFGSQTGTLATSTWGFYTAAVDAFEQNSTNTYTIEFFVYYDTLPPGAWDWLSQTGNNNILGMSSTAPVGNNLTFSIVNIGFMAMGTPVTFSMPPGRWHHVAIIGNSTSTYLAVNGEVKSFGSRWGASAYTTTGAIGAQTWRIGRGDPNGLANLGTWEVFTSQLRFHYGSVGINMPYNTTGFNPPVAPLTAIAGTLLLTCADNLSMRDMSTLNKTISVGTLNNNTQNVPFPLIKSLSANQTATLLSNLNIGTSSIQLVNGTLDFNSKSVTYNGITVSGGCSANVANTGSNVVAVSGTITHTVGNLTLDNNLTVTNASGYTLNVGGLNLGTYALTTPVFTSNNNLSRAINFGTGKIVLSGTTTSTIWNTAATGNLTISSTSLVESRSGGTGVTKTINTGTPLEGGSASFALLETTGTVSYTFTGSAVKDLTINGVQTLTNLPTTVYGSFTHQNTNGTTVLPSTATAITFAGNSSQVLDPLPSFSYNFPITVGSGTSFGSYSLLKNLSQSATRTFTLTSGNLLLGTSTITTSGFTSNNSIRRGIDFGTGKFLLTTSTTSTIWNTATFANLTISGTPIVESNGGGTAITKTISTGAVPESGSIGFRLLEPQFNNGITYVITSNIVRDLVLNGTQTLNLGSANLTVFGSFVHQSTNGTTTITNNTASWNFSATSGNHTITPLAGTTYNNPWVFGPNASTATWSLQSNLALGATRALTISNGTFDFNGWSLTTGSNITATGGTSTISNTNGSIAVAVAPIVQTTANLTISGNVTTTSNFTLNSGTLTLGNSSLLTTSTFTSNNSNVRGLSFVSSGGIRLTAGNTTVFSIFPSTNFTSSGVPYIISSFAGATGTRTFINGFTESQASMYDIRVTGTQGFVIGNTATDTVAFSGGYGNLNLTGLTNTITNAGITGFGDLTLPSTGGTIFTNAITLGSTSSTVRDVTTNGRQVPFPIIFSGTGGNFRLADSFTSVPAVAANKVTLTAGNLNLNNNTLTTYSLTSTGAVARNLDFGTSGTVILTGNNLTLLEAPTATGFTYSGVPRIYSNYTGATGTRTFDFGSAAGGTNTNTFDISIGTSGTGLVIAPGTDILAITGHYSEFNLTGLSQTVTNSAKVVWGNLTIPATGGTLSAGTAALTMSPATGENHTINVNGRSLDFPLTINGTGTATLSSSLTWVSSRVVTLTSGTFNLNDFTLTVGSFNSSGSVARTIDFASSSQIILVGNGSTLLDVTDATGLTYIGTPKIYSNYTGATGTRTFNFGSTAGATITNILDVSIGTSGNGLVVAAGTDSVAFVGNYNNVDLTGLISTSQTVANSLTYVWGNLIIPATGGTLASGTNSTILVPTSTDQTFNVNGRSIPYPLGFGSNTVPLTLTSDLTLDNSFELSAGVLDLNGYTLTALSFISNNTNVRSINFENSGKIILTGSNRVVMQCDTNQNLTYIGTPFFYSNYTGATGTRNFNIGNTAGNIRALLDVSIGSTGSGIIIAPATDSITLIGSFITVDLTGLTHTLTNTTRLIWGNLVVPSTGGTLTAGTSVTTFSFAQSTFLPEFTRTITTNGRILDFPIAIEYAFSSTTSLRLLDALTLGSTRAITLTRGNLDLNNNTLTTLSLDANNSGLRNIEFGDSGVLTLVGSSTTIWNTSTSTNFTWNGNLQVNSTYTGAVGTRTINLGTMSETLAPNIKVTTGSVGFNIGTAADSLALTGSMGDLNLTGMAATITNTAKTVYGNLVIPATGGTLTAGTAIMTLASTRPTARVISTNNRTLDFPMIFNGMGGNWSLTSNISLGSTRSITLTAGNIALSNNVISAATLTSNSTNIRSIDFGSSGRITLAGSSATVIDFTNASNFSYSGIPYINSTYAGAVGTRTFVFGPTGAWPGNAFDVSVSGTSGIIIGTSSDTKALTGSFENVDLTGVAGTISNTTRSIFGNLTIPATGGTLTAGTAVTTLSAGSAPSQANGNSVYFAGGAHLILPSSSTFVFPGDFTIEGWMYFTNTALGTAQSLCGTGSGVNGFDVRWFTSRWQVSLNAATGTDIGTTPAPVNNSWVHVACVRNGSSINLYVNGVPTATTLTSSATLGFDNTLFYVGSSGTANRLSNGLISNLRIVKGQALYTGTFVPSTSPLTAIDVGSTGAGAAANLTGEVVLLTCQGNSFVNSVANQFEFTTLGTVAVSNLSPFGSSSLLSTAVSVGRTLDFPIVVGDFVNGLGTVRLAANLAIGATRSFTLTNGTFDYNNGTLTGANGIIVLSGNVVMANTGGTTASTAVPVTHTSGNLNLNTNFTTTLGYTLTAGTLSLGTRTLTATTFSSTNSNTRRIDFGTGKIVINNSNTATIWDTGTITGLTIGGTPVVETTGSGVSTSRTIQAGALPEASAISFRFLDSMSNGSIGFTGGNTVKNWFVGITGGTIISHTSITIFGSFEHAVSGGGSNPFGTGSASTLTFAATSGIHDIIPRDASSSTYDFPWIFNGAGATWRLQANLGVGATRSVTLNNGTLDFNNNKTITGGTWTIATGTANIVNTGGTIVTTASAVTHTSGNLNLSTNLTTTSVSGYTLTAGNLSLGTSTLTSTIFTSSAANTRRINFGTGKIVLNQTASSATIWNTTPTNLTLTGNVQVESSGGSTNAGGITKTITTGAQPESSPINFSLLDTGGTGSTYELGTSAFGNLTVNGVQTINNTAIIIYGNFVHRTTGGTTTFTAGGVAWTFAATSGNLTISSPATAVYNFPWTFGSAATTATWSLASNVALASARTTTVTRGTLNLGSFTLTTGLFSSSNANTRTINFGTGKIVLNATATGTVWDTSTVTGLTVAGNTSVESTGGGTAITKTIAAGAVTEANTINFSMLETTGTVTYALSGNFGNLAFNGVQTVNNAALNVFGGFSHQNTNGTTTFTAGANTWTFAATSGIDLITPLSGFTYDWPWTFGSAASTAIWRMNGSAILGATRTTTLTAGTLDLNGYTVTTGLFTTAAGTKNLTFNGGTLAVTAAGTSFNNAVPTGFTSNAGATPGTISLTSATAKTFAGGGSTYGAKLNQGGAGTLTVTGNNTFDDFSATAVSAANVTVSFTSGTTNNFNTFTGNGNISYFVTLNSATAGTAANINCTAGTTGVVSVNYYQVADINFRPFSNAGADYIRWYLGANSAPTSATTAVSGALYQTYNPSNIRKVYVLETSTAWQVPSDFNTGDNKIHMFGAGGGGANGGNGGLGGAGGGYTLLANLVLYDTQTIGFAIGAGGAQNPTAGGTTRFSYFSAAGGAAKTSFGPATGPAGGIGSTFSGGDGGAHTGTGTASWPGSGGGAAGGPAGNGTAGTSISTFLGATTSGAGSAGGTTAAGAAGGAGGGSTTGLVPGAPGTIVRELMNTFGTGSGGGGGGVNGTNGGGNGGAGAKFGGGGGGGGYNPNGAGAGGTGGAGGVIIEYTPGVAPPDPARFVSWFS